MAPDYPFYALQSKSLVELGRSNTGNNGVIRLEDMAAEYIEAMRALDSHGPYFVGGWSFGGTVAFEIAQQLHAQGHEVALLALLDTPAPHVLAKVSYLDDAVVLVGLARERARQNGIELDLTPDDVQRLEPAEQFETILRTLKSAGLAPPELDLQYLRDFVKGFRLRLGSAIDYVPKVYPGQITLFRAGRRDQAMRQQLDNVTMETDLEDVAMGWDSLSKKPVEVYQVEGYHELIVAEPHAGLLAERLKASIDKSLAVIGKNSFARRV
jgi:thioesterase domain-containing protein